MDYLIADIRKITKCVKSLRNKTFDQKIIDVIYSGKEKTTREKMFNIKQIMRGEELRQLGIDKKAKESSI